MPSLEMGVELLRLKVGRVASMPSLEMGVESSRLEVGVASLSLLVGFVLPSLLSFLELSPAWRRRRPVKALRINIH